MRRSLNRSIRLVKVYCILLCLIPDRPKWSQPTVKTEKSDEVYVEWKPPTDPAAITGYEVECREKEESRWTKVISHVLDSFNLKHFCLDILVHDNVLIFYWVHITNLVVKVDKT